MKKTARKTRTKKSRIIRSKPKSSVNPVAKSTGVSAITRAELDRWLKALDWVGYNEAIGKPRNKRFIGVSPLGNGILASDTLPPADTLKLYRTLRSDGDNGYRAASFVERLRLLMACDWLVRYVLPEAIEEWLPAWGNNSTGPEETAKALRSCTKTLWTRQLIQALDKVFALYCVIHDERRIGTKEENEGHLRITYLVSRVSLVLGHAVTQALDARNHDSWKDYAWLGGRIRNVIDASDDKLKRQFAPALPRLIRALMEVHDGDSHEFAAECCEWKSPSKRKAA